MKVGSEISVIPRPIRDHVKYVGKGAGSDLSTACQEHMARKVVVFTVKNLATFNHKPTITFEIDSIRTDLSFK